MDSLTIKLESEERHMMKEEERIRRNRGQSRDRKKMGEGEEKIRRNRGQSYRDGTKMGEEEERIRRNRGQSRDGKRWEKERRE